jgi:glycosyltransferase involved in cell wall biosynthesis
MRILVPMEYLGPLGGAERSTLEVSEELARRGHSFIVAYRTLDSFADRWVTLGAELVPVPFLRSELATRQHPVRMLVNSVRCARRLASQKPDLIYCNWLSKLLVCVLLARRLKVPLVVSVREPVGSKIHQLVYGWLLRRASRVVFLSVHQRSAFERARMVPPGCPIIIGGIDLEQYRPATASEREEARKALGVDPNRVVLLYLGRLDPEKGIEVLFEALRRLADPSVELIVAGAPSPYRPDGERYAARLRSSAPPAARFVGRVDDVRPLLWAADVIVVPSTWDEPFGRVPVEAMACGVPVIAARSGGMPETLSGELEPLLFDPSDPEALIAALHRSCVGLGSTVRWHECLREIAVGRFSLQAEADQLEAVFSSSAAEGGASGR